MRRSLHQCELPRTMDFLLILVLALYITQALTKSRAKKHKASASEEGSIENLLYYKDCQRNAKPEPLQRVMPMHFEMTTTTTPPPPPPPQCLFPKMCCALTCGNECGGSQPASVMMQSEQSYMPPTNTATNIRRGRINPAHPPMQQFQRRKKRIRPPPNNLLVGNPGGIPPGFPSRRDFSGFTKEKIKGLIAKDDDIRKILKDLVRVTMQKVDLQEMINARRDWSKETTTVTTTTVDDSYVDDFVE